MESGGGGGTKGTLLVGGLSKPLPPTTAAAKGKGGSKQMECPRCGSWNTKFCYYNNYNKKQPRHLCKSCKRHWTNGGTLRNVPLGRGGRKNININNNNNKRLKSTSSTTPTSGSNHNNNNNNNSSTNHLSFSLPPNRTKKNVLSPPCSSSNYSQEDDLQFPFSSSLLLSPLDNSTSGNYDINDWWYYYNNYINDDGGGGDKLMVGTTSSSSSSTTGSMFCQPPWQLTAATTSCSSSSSSSSSSVGMEELEKYYYYGWNWNIDDFNIQWDYYDFNNSNNIEIIKPT